MSSTLKRTFFSDSKPHDELLQSDRIQIVSLTDLQRLAGRKHSTLDSLCVCVFGGGGICRLPRIPLLVGLPRWLTGRESACQGRRCLFSPWLGRIHREGNGNPPQYSCLGNPMGRGAWWATVHGVTKSQTRLSG